MHLVRRTADWSEADGSDLPTQGGFILIDSGILFEFLSSNVRSLGRGFSAIQHFSLYVNSPPPMISNNYRKIFRTVHSASKEVALDSMRLAAKELKEAGTEDCVVDRAVSVDETWQHRGHASHHDVVTALSNESGKCLAVEVLSNIYKGCQFWSGKEGTEEHYSWGLRHQCKVNHKGRAGAMEAIGAAFEIYTQTLR